MNNAALQSLTDRLAADRTVTATEALEVRRSVFPDGVVTRDEAELLISLASRVANSDEDWSRAFVEAMTDHVLASGANPGHVDESTTSWLGAHMGNMPPALVVETFLKVQERAESTPPSFSEAGRNAVAAMLSARPIGALETELVRRCLFASAGCGRTSVTEAEARWMFALDAEADGRANDPAWSDLFIKAVLCHLMGRQMPDLLEANGMKARQAWLSSPSRGLGATLSSMFDGGLSGFKSKIGQARALERLEGYYEIENHDTQADAEMTLAEMAWATGMTKEDGRQTANEVLLLSEIRKLDADKAT